MARGAKLTGLDKLQRRLFQLPKEAVKEIKIAMEKSANEIVALMKTLAPVGQYSGIKGSNNPGALRDSIGWTWGNAPKGTISLGTVRGGSNAKDLKITIFAGSKEAYYARWVEFGTRAHGIDVKNAVTMGRAGVDFGKHVDHPGAKATPFFFPAYRAMRKRARTRIGSAVRKSIKNTIRK